MRLWHDPPKISASFDDPNLVSRAGLVPVMSLAERAGLHGLVRRHVEIAGLCGASADMKVGCLVAGMAAGADSVDDMNLLRHGAVPEVFAGVRAPSTLGSFLRSFTFGNVRQLETAGREFLAELARRVPLLPGAETLALVDFDSMQRRVYGHKKQGAGFGHTKIQGKTVLVRGGSANSARGAASFAAGALGTARSAGCTGTIVARADSGFYCAAFAAACQRGGAYFSVTARMDPAVSRAIASIAADAWTPIRYPHAIWDDQLRSWVSDAEVAETAYTAFASRKGQAVTARLIVRRVRDQNRKAADGQGELFPAWRHHPVFTDSPFELIQAEEHHRDHAIVEQVFADWSSGPMAHLPSGRFAANAAWLACAVITHNLLRAAGCLASRFHARARGATIRADLIAVAARTARRGNLILHLPRAWHREAEWTNLFEAACGPPRAQHA